MTVRLNTLLNLAKTVALGGAMAVGGALAASAMEAPAFSDVDSNVDGVISQEEFLAAMPEGTADTFISADVNGDTVLSQDEYETMAAMMQ